jgi:type I restriction enzyme S subunit
MVGRVCRYDRKETSLLNQRVGKIYSKDLNRLNEDFLFYFMKQYGITLELASSAGGSANQANISPGQIRELSIYLPPIQEQTSIASILSSLDDKIDLLHRQNKTLEALAETLFRQWFVEEADEGWGKAKLGEFIEIKHGHAFSGAHIVADETDKILVTPGNFNIGGGFSFAKFKYYNADDFPISFAFDEGDFIVTMTDLSQDTDTLGYPAFVPTITGKHLLHNQRVGKVVFRKDHSDKRNFIYHLMRSGVYRHYIIGRSTGMAVRHTSPSSICDFEFALPDSSIIRRFENQVESYRERERSNQLQSQTLTQLRDTLLPKLMSGEVRVGR